jgi:hypothetical protein
VNLTNIDQHSIAVFDRKTETVVRCGNCGEQLGFRLLLGSPPRTPPTAKGKHISWQEYEALCELSGCSLPAVYFSLAWTFNIQTGLWEWTNRAKRAARRGGDPNMPNRAHKLARGLGYSQDRGDIGLPLRRVFAAWAWPDSGHPSGEPTRAQCPFCPSVQILDNERLMCEPLASLQCAPDELSIAQTINRVRLPDSDWQRLSDALGSENTFGFEWENVTKGRPIVLQPYREEP